MKAYIETGSNKPVRLIERLACNANYAIFEVFGKLEIYHDLRTGVFTSDGKLNIIERVWIVEAWVGDKVAHATSCSTTEAVSEAVTSYIGYSPISVDIRIVIADPAN